MSPLLERKPPALSPREDLQKRIDGTAAEIQNCEVAIREADAEIAAALARKASGGSENEFMRGAHNRGWASREAKKKALENREVLEQVQPLLAAEMQALIQAEANEKLTSAVDEFPQYHEAEEAAYRAAADAFAAFVRSWEPLVAACEATDVARANVEAIATDATDATVKFKWAGVRNLVFTPRPATLAALTDLFAVAGIDPAVGYELGLRVRAPMADLVEGLRSACGKMPTPPGVDVHRGSGAFALIVQRVAETLEREAAAAVPQAPPAPNPEREAAAERFFRAQVQRNPRHGLMAGAPDRTPDQLRALGLYVAPLEFPSEAAPAAEPDPELSEEDKAFLATQSKDLGRLGLPPAWGAA